VFRQECFYENGSADLSFCLVRYLYSPEKTPVEGNSWQNVITRRAMGGLQVAAECDENAVFTLKNQYGEFTFTARQMACNERLVFPLGGKYGFCVITIARYGYYWFRPENFLPGMVQFNAEDLPLRVEDRRLGDGREVIAPPERDEVVEASAHARGVRGDERRPVRAVGAAPDPHLLVAQPLKLGCSRHERVVYAADRADAHGSALLQRLSHGGDVVRDE
jgi:hypothetical protein